MRLRFLSVLLVATQLIIWPAQANLLPEAIPAVFEQLLNQPALANPAVVLMDGATGEIIYEKNPFAQRKPASVMKLFAGASVIRNLDLNSQFTTNASFGAEAKTLVIQGSYDPWISTSHEVARKMQRASLSHIATLSLYRAKQRSNGSVSNFKILYSGLYSQDIANLKQFWAKKKFKPQFIAVNSEEATLNSAELITSEISPKVSEILKWTLLWSDNNLAERLARLSAKAAGLPFNIDGVTILYINMLIELGIDPSKLVIKDASGLSKENRVTAQMIGQLLYQLHEDEKYKILFDSLPIGGVSGTLRSRFLTTAPGAVGLVRAKTGTLNGTVTLAGVVQSSDREYIFVTLADQISNGMKASDRARAAIDRLLGRIAAPNIPAEISEVPETHL